MGKILFKIVADNACELSFVSEDDSKMEIELVTRKEMLRGLMSSGQICTLTFGSETGIQPSNWERVTFG